MSSGQPDRNPSPLPPLRPLNGTLLLALVALKLAIHLPLLGRYGYFRDELYFLDCGRHLAWGYVDMAPLIAWLARAVLELGGALELLRLVPALAGAGLVALTVVLARQLGGGAFAQAAAGLAVIVSPIFLAFASLFTMNALEPLFWTGCALLLVHIVRTGDSRWWLLFGVLAGLGLMNKHSTLFFGFATAVAVLLTPLRRELSKRWIWLGAGIALLIFLPNLIWQAANDFPTLEDLRNVRETGKNVALAPGAFIA
ncbi:MAG TPA: glycosyltransferase family 39 protein, partial [Candidatus Sulfomarinibacteraceae bacterium]|nr:glycosyltransferase family 39 protein [Candidatus Sulfomarinibacteraceae bacterium]